MCEVVCVYLFFKQKTAYEMRISDWSSDVCSSDLHNKVLHERNIVLHLVFVEEPWVGMDKRTTLQPFGNGFWRITMKFGFMNVPDVPRALQLCNKHQGLRLDDDPDDVTYFLSRLTARSEEHTSELQSLMRI